MSTLSNVTPKRGKLSPPCTRLTPCVTSVASCDGVSVRYALSSSKNLYFPRMPLISLFSIIIVTISVCRKIVTILLTVSEEAMLNFIRVTSFDNKHVRVEVEGVCLVSTAYVPTAFMEKK